MDWERIWKATKWVYLVFIIVVTGLIFQKQRIAKQEEFLANAPRAHWKNGRWADASTEVWNLGTITEKKGSVPDKNVWIFRGDFEKYGKDICYAFQEKGREMIMLSKESGAGSVLYDIKYICFVLPGERS